MPRSSRPFARVYYDDLESDHGAVFYNPTALSTWLRLLILAEKAWPSMPQLPAAVRRADLETLRKDGLLFLLENGKFELRGWVKERTERGTKGGTKGHPEGLPEGGTEGVPSVPPSVPIRTRALSPSSSSSSSSSTEGVQGEPDAFEAFHRRTGQVPGTKLRSWLNDLSSKFGDGAVSRAIGATPLDDHSAPDYLRSIADQLALEAHRAERQERQDEAARLAEKRRPIAVRRDEDISEEEAKRLAAEYLAKAVRA